MDYFNKKAEEIWINKVIAELLKIEVASGKCVYNFRCHNNAIHEAIKSKDKKVAVVIYIKDDVAILHFVNYHKDKYIDNTLGFWSKFNDYYFLRWIEECDLNENALVIFDKIRKQWSNMIPLSWRWLVDTTI